MTGNSDVGDAPLVSVIIIFLNEKTFLQEAIDSVLAQDYANWELLLVDDGSTDESAEIARMAAARMPAKIRYLRHPDGQNHGMSASRNLGLSRANGEYIAYLDADDLFFPFKLGAQVADLQTHGVEMTFGRVLFWYWDERFRGEPDYIQDLGDLPGKAHRGQYLLARILDDENLHPAPHGMLIRRMTALQVGGFENSFRGMYEDSAFLTKLLLKCRVYVSAECFGAYRMHSRSCCHQAQENGIYSPLYPSSSRLVFLKWAEKCLRENPTDLLARLALHRELMSFSAPRIRRLLDLCIVRPCKRMMREITKLRARFRSKPPDRLSANPLDASEALRRIEAFYVATGRQAELNFLLNRSSKSWCPTQVPLTLAISDFSTDIRGIGDCGGS